MALSPISDAEVALPTPVWEGGEGGSSGKRKAVLWITQEVGSQRGPAECGEPGVLVHAYTPNIEKDQEFKGHPLLYNMKSAWLREALFKTKQNHCGAVSPTRKIWLHMGEERTGNQDSRREEKQLPQYHSAWMPTSVCKTGRTVLLLSAFFPTRD